MIELALSGVEVKHREILFTCRTSLTVEQAHVELPGAATEASFLTMKDRSPDYEDRLKDFWARHGGAGTRADRVGESVRGVQGWSEVYARDGYVLRCDWSAMGSLHEMKYSEIAPSAAASP